MSLVYLSLGSNLGNKEQNLNDAIIQISIQAGRVLNQSSFYISKPWGYNSENDFANGVVLIQTDLSPLELLTKTQAIETEMGRTTKSGTTYADRLIDIDILFYDNLIIDLPTLKIPHPLIAERDFVIIPLREIAPDFTHPLSGKKYLKSDAKQTTIQ